VLLLGAGSWKDEMLRRSPSAASKDSFSSRTRQDPVPWGTMDTDKDDRVQLNVRVRPGARKALKALAALRGQGQSEVLEEMIEEALQAALVEAADEIKRQGRRVVP
jgi:hypothetical protein